MMRRHARSQNQRIVRKLNAGVASATGAVAAAAEIGSRVLPLRAQPASMPSVGARRSTRVFVPKAAASPRAGDPESRLLRSGKRLALSDPKGKRVDGEDEWFSVFGGPPGAYLRWWRAKDDVFGGSDERSEPKTLQTDADAVTEESMQIDTQSFSVDSTKQEWKYGAVYFRKRRQREMADDGASSSSSVGDAVLKKDRRYGIFFMRRERRKKLKLNPLVGGIKLEHEEILKGRRMGARKLRIADSARNFAMAVGILEDDLMITVAGRMVLAVFVESSCSSVAQRMSRQFFGIFCWLRRARFRMWDLAVFLLSGSVASVFSQQGVHFLPLRLRKSNAIFRSSLPSFGFCKIYGARKSIPMLWLDFLALPFFFKSLHFSVLLGSLYLPRVLARYLMCLPADIEVDVGLEEVDSDVAAETGYSGIEVAVADSPSVTRKDSHDIIEPPRSVVRNRVIVHGSKLLKHQKKRSSSRHLRRKNSSSMHSHAACYRNSNTVSIGLKAKACALPDLLVEPTQLDSTDPLTDDSLSCQDESDVSTPVGSIYKQRKQVKKSAAESSQQTKELRSALAEVKQNILTVHCKANVLVTAGDRCWREEGFQVMLHLSVSGDCCIAVKAQGELRYLHMPQVMKPCVVNRYTHAYMWTGQDGWKLEFLDRWDWLVFKELHMECYERNRQEVCTKVIPVPGVVEVSGYDDYATASFVQPEWYIKMVDDEVQRALASEIAVYDMDSGDEIWLKNFNSSLSLAEDSGFSNISQEQFEKIIYTFEKDAYINVDEIFDRERAMDLYLYRDFGGRDTLSAIYDYWIKKRNKKHAALTRVFQGPPLRRVQLVHKPFLRKKRSFKRQRSQSARLKQDVVLEAGVKEGAALQRVQEAESAATRAVQSAIILRSRAQTLMANAELATYKAVMALRIVESIRVSESSDLLSSILD